jgi:glycogen debranching enzyme
MRTLDPSDSHYRGYYDNSNNSDDYYMAGGFSYHMGPEWVWPMGFFLRARLQFRSKPPVTVLNQLQRILQAHREAIDNSDWKGLPELTQKDGAFCPGSCTTQAWSASCILEAMYDLQHY